MRVGPWIRAGSWKLKEKTDLKNVAFIRAGRQDVLVESWQDDGRFEVVGVENSGHRSEELDGADDALVPEGANALAACNVPQADIEILEKRSLLIKGVKNQGPRTTLLTYALKWYNIEFDNRSVSWDFRGLWFEFHV